MKKWTPHELIFMALCCDIGLISKKVISPMTNIVTDYLHIPGGIATSFSLIFILLAAILVDQDFSATLMSFIQSILAIIFGTVGSMGALAPIGYVIPGIMIDLVIAIVRHSHRDITKAIIPASMLASLAACLTANIIVFRLPLIPLLLYGCVSLTSGAICGWICELLATRLQKAIHF